MTDILDAIGAVTAPVCAWCSRTLRPDGLHHDFCDESCQTSWACGASGAPPASAADSVAAAMLTMASAVGECLRGLRAAVDQAVIDMATLADAILVEKPLPTEPMARALELRRRRNTGPPAGRRPPTWIDATRRRSWP